MSKPTTVAAVYSIRDTATRADITTGIYSHIGQALAWLSSHVVGLQRISFELYQLGEVVLNESNETSIVSFEHRVYIMSASQAILDSYHENAEDLLDEQDSTDSANSSPNAI